MPSVYDLKHAFQNVLRPFAHGLADRGVTPNQVTLAAAALSVVTGAWLAWGPASSWGFLALPVVMFLRMALNAIDGIIARERGMKTPLGALLNELCDTLSDAATYLPFAWIAGAPPELTVLTVAAVVLAGTSEAAGLAALSIGASRRYDGPMGKSDRAVVFGALAILLGLGVSPGLWTTLCIGAVCALTALTIVNRARKALDEVGFAPKT
jgi:CDP-diacylglycerol--glycerol-3-phosphate 3-phosphatidyltransferase